MKTKKQPAKPSVLQHKRAELAIMDQIETLLDSLNDNDQRLKRIKEEFFQVLREKHEALTILEVESIFASK